MNWVSDCRNFKIPSHGAFEANKFVIEIRRLVGNFADACRDNFVCPTAKGVNIFKPTDKSISNDKRP